MPFLLIPTTSKMAKELTLPFTVCHTQQNRPCTSSGQQRGIDPVHKGMGELPLEYEHGRSRPRLIYHTGIMGRKETPPPTPLWLRWVEELQYSG